jgi:two-component system sensor histidine kinase DegS
MADASPAPAEQAGDLRTRLEAERSKVERELAEMDMLMQQATTEAERYEGRRQQAAQRLEALEQEQGAAPEALREANAQLLNQTRRAAVMQAQTEVLEGKQRGLQRISGVVEDVLGSLDTAAGIERPAAAADNPRDEGPSREVLAAQEEMRREIARQMHDGPAQSIANIALQAEVVQRLFTREPSQAAVELGQLVEMVQHALEATKTFIFDVRPMVLDDLGLVPTLRRTAAERSRRTGIEVGFQSAGIDRRLPPELESGLFRVLDDAVVGYLVRQPASVAVVLEWNDEGVQAVVRARPTDAEAPEGSKARAVIEAAQRDKRLPAALVTMIHDQERKEAAESGMPEEIWLDIKQRAASTGFEVTLSPDGWQFDATVMAA